MQSELNCFIYYGKIRLVPIAHVVRNHNYRIYSSISRTFLYLKISPKTGVRLILEASEMTCSNHGTYTYENMRLPYLF